MTDYADHLANAQALTREMDRVERKIALATTLLAALRLRRAQALAEARKSLDIGIPTSEQKQ
jgi:hypothetical protein